MEELRDFDLNDDSTENAEKGFEEKKDDSDKSIFSCKQCTFVTHNKRGISIHITTMHKNGKSGPTKTALVEDTESVEFSNEEVVKSTQVTEENPGAEEIAKMYEESDTDMNLDEAITIPDNDTIDMIMKSYENEDLNPDDGEKNDEEKDNPGDDLFTENVLLKSKLKSAKENIKTKDSKISECEEQMELMTTEISNQTKTADDLVVKMRLKNEEASLLIAEKNSLDELRMKAEEKTVRFMKTVEKLYQEKNILKKELDKKKNTIDLMNKGTSPATDTDDSVKDIKDKLKEKTKKLEEANNEKKRLARDLAKAEDKLKDVPTSDNENGRVEKLANLLKVKKRECKTNQDELKKVNLTLSKLQEKLNTSTNKTTTLEAKNIRLEKQCDDLLEALEKEETVETVSEKKSVKNKPVHEREDTKCKKHDKGKCFHGSKCNYSHTSNIVCKSFSKFGFCRDEEECINRHPAGVCLHWRRAVCEKGLRCFYQHPDKDYGSLSRDGGHKDAQEPKRKRSSSYGSPPQSLKVSRTETERAKSSGDSFLAERLAKLKKEVEFHRRNQVSPAQVIHNQCTW